MKKLSDKVYCYPDTLQNKYLPQSWQIFIMKNFIEKYKKKIEFYTGENHKSYHKMTTFQEKINSNPEIHGFVFYSLLQFCYDKKINTQLFKESVNRGYTVYLAREKVVINKKNFFKKKNDLFFFKFTNSNLIKIIKKNFGKK